MNYYIFFTSRTLQKTAALEFVGIETPLVPRVGETINNEGIFSKQGEYVEGFSKVESVSYDYAKNCIRVDIFLV